MVVVMTSFEGSVFNLELHDTILLESFCSSELFGTMFLSIWPFCDSRWIKALINPPLSDK